MEEFLRSYGIWIVIAAAFIGLHWFGMGCGGGHRHGRRRENERVESETTPAADSAPRRGRH
jgi:hypothetical protein